jgi:hypothetical protein
VGLELLKPNRERLIDAKILLKGAQKYVINTSAAVKVGG